MSETTINQRLKFLLNRLEMKAGAFARALDLSETTIRNYTDRTAKPSSDVLEKISSTFKQVNLVWLITGQGEPLLSDSIESAAPQQTNIKNNAGVGVSHGGTNNFTSHLSIHDCQRELESAQKEIEYLKAQLATERALVASKDDFIALLRASYNRPN